MYPITINLTDKEVYLIGGGKIAARKIKGLVSEEAKITVIGPSLHEDISLDQVNWVKKRYEKGDIPSSAYLVFACTNDNQLNESILNDVESSQLVNVVSNKLVSDFYNMSMIKHNGLKIGISTEGASPLVAKKTRIKLQEWLSKQEE